MQEQNVAVYVLGFFVSWGIIAIFSAICRAIGRLFTAPEAPKNPWDVVHETIAREIVRLPNNRCMRAELKWVEDDLPMEPREVVVHNRADAEHVKGCAECRDGLKPRYSGVSHRPSN